MKASSLSLALTLTSLWWTAAPAETMVVEDQVVVRPSSVEVPARGQKMSVVEAKFGAPQTRHAAVGTPPITRWDYANFSVFFENDLLIDAVAVGP